MESSSGKHKRTGLIIGCGNHNPNSVMEIKGGKWEDTPIGKIFSPAKRTVDHHTLHPNYLTVDLPKSEYKPDIESDLRDPKLADTLAVQNEKDFTQIIVERLPPVAIDKTALQNLANLSASEGITILALSRFLGSSMPTVSSDIVSGQVEKSAKRILHEATYLPEQYEFFANLKAAGFKTIIALDDSGLNYALFKVEPEEAKKLLEAASQKPDYLGKILRKEILITQPADLIFIAVDDAYQISQKAFRELIALNPQIATNIQNLKDSAIKKELLELLDLTKDPAKPIPVLYMLALLLKHQIIDKKTSDDFLKSYNNLFALDKNHQQKLQKLLDLKTIEKELTIFYKNRKEAKADFIKLVEKTISQYPTTPINVLIIKTVNENKELFIKAISGKNSRVRDALIEILGEKNFNDLKKEIETTLKETSRSSKHL